MARFTHGEPHFAAHHPRLQGESVGVSVDLQIGRPAAQENFVVALGEARAR
jgi:hypothetical protein